jgi:hypothetical protein
MRFLKTALLAAFLLPLTLAAQVYNTVVFNRNGQPIAGASVAVCLTAPPQPLSSSNACGNGNFATLYTNQNLTTPASNPATTDAYGNAVIFAQPGVYWTVVYGYLITPHQNIIAVPSGSGGTPHNLLSATHPDTVAFSPPALGDLVVGDGSGKWADFPANHTVSQYCLISAGNGTDVTSIAWGACPGGSATATYQHNTITVAQQPKLNFLDSSSVQATVTNNSGNSSVDVSFAAAAPLTLPPPLFVPAGQAVAWAFPTTCATYQGTPGTPFNPTGGGIGDATDANINCAIPGGTLSRYGSGPLHDVYNYGMVWSDFVLPTLPNDAVIQNVYPVSIMSLTGVPIGFMTLNCTSSPTSTQVYSFSNALSSGYFFSNTSIGSSSGAVTAATCNLDSASSVSASGSYIDNTNAVALAIYYTTATPPSSGGVNLSLPATYATLPDVAPSFVALSDASPITLNPKFKYFDDRIVTLNHTTSTRALNAANMVSGGFYHVAFLQDSTGGAQVTLGTGCNWIVNNSPTSTLNIPLTANAVSVAEIVYDGTYCYVDLTQNNSGTTLSNAGQWQPGPTGYVSGQIVQYNSCSYMASRRPSAFRRIPTLQHGRCLPATERMVRTAPTEPMVRMGPPGYRILSKPNPLRGRSGLAVGPDVHSLPD